MTEPFNPTALAAAEATRDKLMGKIAIQEANALAYRVIEDEIGEAVSLMLSAILRAELDVSIRRIALETALKRLEDVCSEYAEPLEAFRDMRAGE
jgi:hypothetical protein